MTWTRLDEDFVDRPDLLDLSRSARLLHVEGLVWCNRQGTNGRIPAKVIRRLSDTENLDDELDELEAAWLWIRSQDGSWQIEKWVEREHQELAQDVKDRKKLSAERQARFRKRRSMHLAGDHSECEKRYCKDAGPLPESKQSRPRSGQSSSRKSPVDRCAHGNSLMVLGDGTHVCPECEDTRRRREQDDSPVEVASVTDRQVVSA